MPLGIEIELSMRVHIYTFVMRVRTIWLNVLSFITNNGGGAFQNIENGWGAF